MADNVAITTGSGTNIATDDISGVHYQIIKLAWGALDTATLVGSGANSVPIQDGGNSITVDGTVTSNAGTGNFSSNIAQAGGNTINTGSGAAGTGTLRIILSTDSPGFYVEDVAAGNNTTGVAMLGIRTDTPGTSKTNANGDWTHLTTSAYDQLHVSPSDRIGIAVTPTVSTTAYTAGDAVGGAMTFTNSARWAAGTGAVRGVIVTNQAKTGTPMDLILATSSLSGTTVTDNAVLDIADADMARIFARIPLIDWCQLNDNEFCAVNDSWDFYLTSDANIYGALVTRNAMTLAATTDIVVRLLIERD